MNRRRKRLREDSPSSESGEKSSSNPSADEGSGKGRLQRAALPPKRQASSETPSPRSTINPGAYKKQARKATQQPTPPTSPPKKAAPPKEEPAPKAEDPKPSPPAPVENSPPAEPQPPAQPQPPAASPAEEPKAPAPAAPVEKPAAKEEAKPPAETTSAPQPPASAASASSTAQIPPPKNPPAPTGEKPATEATDNSEPSNFPRFHFKSFSILEKVSLGILTAGLLALAIWATSSVAATIPENPDAKRTRFPVQGEAAVLASLETYWRNPVRSGENIDEGVSRDIELIPAAKVVLGEESRAQALRFLFRDEEGRYAGDATTLRIANGEFQNTSAGTSRVDGRTARIRATTGFLHEGEIITYLSDDNFQWHLVILESKDGSQFKELLTIPISASKRD